MRDDDASWPEVRLSRLVAHLCADHVHLRYEILGELARTFAYVSHSGARDLFTQLAEKLRKHLTREEHVLFPMIEQMEKARREASSLPPPLERGLRPVIDHLIEEHKELTALVRQLRNHVEVGDRVAALEAALHNCMHLENRVLYPRALALEQQLYEVTPRAAAGSPGTSRSHGLPPPRRRKRPA